MSGQATGWVLRHGPKDRAMRSVLLTIADAANRDGEHAHPGTAAIVEGSLYSLPHVKRVLRRLIEEGWIEVEEQGGGRGIATTYRMSMKGPKPARQEEPDHGAETGSLRTSLPVETGSSVVETGSSSEFWPLSATVSGNGSAPASDDAAATARRLVQNHWERCKSENKPVPTLRGDRGSPFMALAHIVQGLVEAGHTPLAVAAALWTTKAYTTNALTLELNHRKNGGDPSKPASWGVLQRRMAQHQAAEAGA